MRHVRVLLVFASSLLLVFLLFRLTLFLIPYPELDAYRARSYGLVLQDRGGAVLRVLPAGDGVKREWAGLEEMPAGVVRVFIRAEDRRFYLHPGVDLIAVAGSALRNLRSGRVVSGASTITMQLARIIRSHGPGLGGKIGEAWDALRLEAHLSKKEILELWLNGIPFGSNIEGLPAMARARFGLPLARMDDGRAALLAVVPRRPARYDPAYNREAAVNAALTLSVRCRLGLDESALRQAALEARKTDDDRITGERATFHAPHFTERAAALLQGEAAPLPHSIRTTLDLGLQSYAEERLTAELAALTNNRVTNGAILAIENDTGAIRVYVGSSSWFNEDNGGKIDGVRVFNQPGSCLKPFLYALALDSGFSPADILPDLPTMFGGSEAYIPSNFNRRFNGPVRLRLALASSLNIPAVYTLERLGVSNFEEYLVSLGFDSISANRGSHGTGLALGNAEVSLEELVRAFSAFPRGGSPAVLRLTEDVPQNADDPTDAAPILSPYTAWVIADILSDRASRFVGFGPAPTLATAFPSMFKTGTANQFQHIWALGATRRFTVGVWMGNFSGETVVGRTGSSIPARIAADLLGALEQPAGASSRSGTISADVGGPVPARTERVRICALSGMTATPACTGTLDEWIPADRISGPCSWHRGETGAENSWASTVSYPPEYQAWIAERFRSGTVSRNQGGGTIRIPLPGSVFYLDTSIPADAQALRIETTGFGPDAYLYADDQFQGVLNPAGVYALPLVRGRHRVQVEDEYGASASVEFEVR
jgi:penicillin-binding protein 1C